MGNLQWTSEKGIKESLVKVNIKSPSDSGIPLFVNGDESYILGKEVHTLVLGTTGSGKTQATILPTMRLALGNEESVIVNDVKGELYKIFAGVYRKAGYNVYCINFENPSYGNSWNPLSLIYKTYKDGNRDVAIREIENIGYYLLGDKSEISGDPFWINATIDFFTGLTLYLFENAKEEEINLNSISSLANDLSFTEKAKEFMGKIDKNSSIYFNLTTTLNAPKETRSSIISVFNQKIKKYISFEGLSNLLLKSDFDLSKIFDEKIIIFLVSGRSSSSTNLIPLFVNQCVDAADRYRSSKKRINILLDEFDLLLPIRNFSKLIHYSRSIGVKFIVCVSSLFDLSNVYGKENYELIKACFGNIIYLLANDLFTLEEVSKLCGEVNGKSLISVEELKLLKNFEAIVLVPRKMPYRGMITPDYKIDWGMEKIEEELPKRDSNSLYIYSE